MNTEELTKFVSDGFEKAKAGDAIAVYQQVAPFHDDNSLHYRSHYPFGWIIYYALHQSPDHEIEARKHMLARYLKLKVMVPHKLHSMILTQAVRLYRNARDNAFNKNPQEVVKFSLLNFLKLWNLQNLRPGDWRRKDFEGKQMSSLVEKMITLAIDEAESLHQIPFPEFMQVVDQAVASFPDSFNLLSQRASIHILAHEDAKAAELLKGAILMAPGKFFLWSKLASIIPVAQDSHLHVALLYKALRAPGPEEYKGRIRISMADALASKGAFPQALFELLRVKSLYEANGWHLSPRFNSVMAKIPQGIQPDDPARIYRKVEHLADEYVYSALPLIPAAKTFHKNPDPQADNRGYGRPAVAWRVTDETGYNYWFKPERWGIDPNLPSGTRVAIQVANGKVVKAKLI